MDTLAELRNVLTRDGTELVLAGLRGAALDSFMRSDLAHGNDRDRLAYPTVCQAVRPTGHDHTDL